MAELDEATKERLAKLVAMRKMERELNKNFQFFGGDDRMHIRLFDWSKFPPAILEFLDEIIDNMAEVKNEHP